MTPKNDLQGKIIHLMNRASFGSNPDFIIKHRYGEISTVINVLFKDSILYTPLTLKSTEPNSATLKSMSSADKQAQRKKNKETLLSLNIDWIKRMQQNESMFREKLALFWHNHFACRHDKPSFVLSYINTIRKHSLGSFREMLLAISHEPAMLDFLNNRTNKKEHPNENFAREVMELFTIGRGNYTETDVKEAARAFTGYSISPEGTFMLRPNWHDEGEKTFMGKTGNLTGDEILSILLSKKETALFLSRKIYRFFVNEEIDEANAQEMADVFYNSDYNIEKLFKHIFTSTWFFEPKNPSAIIKSPVELIVGLNRMCGIIYEEEKSMLLVQHMLGQILFYPPNVAGWPGGKNWIDNSRLMTRLRLASILLNSGEIEWNDEKDDAENTLPEKFRKQIQKKFGSLPNWEYFNLAFPGETMVPYIDMVVGEMQTKTAREIIYSIRDKSKKDQAIVLFSLPEFQTA